VAGTEQALKMLDKYVHAIEAKLREKIQIRVTEAAQKHKLHV